MTHTYAEYIQFKSVSSIASHFSSFYNVLDAIIVVSGPIVLILQLLSVFSSVTIDWADHENYINVEGQVWYTMLQTQLYSFMTFAACMKLFDYLNVFQDLNRLMVMIEMMAGELKNFLVIMALSLFTFTVSEYIAYGYKDENSYSIGKGFLARVYGLFSGDPITFGHTDSGTLLGTFYVMCFLILVPMLLMNLLVAMLTSAYDEARNQSSDVLAQRQYDKMDGVGLTKRRKLTIKTESGTVLQEITTTLADDSITFLDHFDQTVMIKFYEGWAKYQNWMDRRDALIYKIKKTKKQSHH